MTIANEITRISNAKAAIKQSIENKGVTVSDTAKLDEYPALIDSISGEGGSVDAGYWPKFFEARTKNLTDLKYAFANIEAKETDTDIKNLIENLDTSKVKEIRNAFEQFGAYSKPLKFLDLTKWNVEKVNNGFDKVFYFCRSSIDISGWKFTKVNSLYQFTYYSYATTIVMRNCDTSTINNMSYCFGYCEDLVSVDITGCDTSKVTNMNYTFNNSKKLVDIIGEIDASSLSNGFYPGSGSAPFYSCNALETVYIKNIYKDIPVTNVAKYSLNLANTKVKDECLIYIINELPDLINDKGLTATDKIVLTLPPTNTLTSEQVQPALDKGWNVANTNY